MDSPAALKKIIRMNPSISVPTVRQINNMNRVDLALEAAQSAILWGNIHITTMEELALFKQGLLKIVEEQR